MNRRIIQTVVRQLAELSADAGADRPDAELLGRFVAEKDGAAFAALVRRHGPMVWAACRHLLPNPADAEDAFQATFLALAQQAKWVRDAAALGGWLHGVAVKASLKVRRSEARRKGRERASAGPEACRPVPDSAWDGLLAAVHEEVQRLPDALRTVFVLCDLEGVPQPAAAARLGWKPGTLTGRLTRARQHLLAQLTRRGLAPAVAAGGIGTAATGAAVPPGLNQTVLMLVGDPVRASAAVTVLVTEVTAMTLTKVKLLAAGLMVAGGLGLGVGAGRVANVTAQAPATTEPAKPAPAAPPVKPTPAVAPAKDAGRTAWEYLFEETGDDPAHFVGILQSRGTEGWEYADRWDYRQSSGAKAGVVMLVFKRPKATTAVAATPAKSLHGVIVVDSPAVEVERSPLATKPRNELTGSKLEPLVEVERSPLATKPRPAVPPARAAQSAPVAPPITFSEAQNQGTVTLGATFVQPPSKPRTPAPEPLILPVKHISVNDASSMVQLYLEDVKEMRVQAIGTTNTLVLFNVPPAAAARVADLLKRVDVPPAAFEERPAMPGNAPAAAPGFDPNTTKPRKPTRPGQSNPFM